MKRFSEQLHNKAKSVKLQAAEKQELRERLVSYMEYHPLPASMKAGVETKTARTTAPLTEVYHTFSIPFATFFKSSAVAAAIVLVAVPFLAERAVPGDTLYAIKVQFNEELRSTLTFDSYQKVEWETERLNRRIAEARLLASEGRLTEEVEAEVAAAVKEHTETAKREIEALRAEDADDAAIASIALDTTLEVQSAALKSEEASDEAETTDVRSTNLIANAIDESRGQAEDYTYASSTPPAYNKLMARVEQNTTRVYELMGALEEVVSAEELAEVTRRSEDIGRSIEEAIALATEDEGAARLKLVDVLQRTQKLIVFMTELEVDGTVDIESLVPVELTEEEEQAAIEETMTTLETKIARINALQEVVGEEAVLEKVDAALVIIAEKAAEMATSTDDFVTFQTIARETMTLTDDTLALLERWSADLVLPEEEVEVTGASSTEEVIEESEEEIASPTEETGSEEQTGSSTEETDVSEEEPIASSTEEIVDNV